MKMKIKQAQKEINKRNMKNGKKHLDFSCQKILRVNIILGNKLQIKAQNNMRYYYMKNSNNNNRNKTDYHLYNVYKTYKANIIENKNEEAQNQQKQKRNLIHNYLFPIEKFDQLRKDASVVIPSLQRGSEIEYGRLRNNNEKQPLLVKNTNSKMVNKPTEKKEGKSKTIRLIFYIIIYCVYLIMGGLIFQIVEIPAEKTFRENLRNVRTNFMDKYPNIKDDDLEDLIAEISKANDRGISALKNASSEFNWSFGQSLFFSSTVITTIGYGHVTPLSQTGKIFCMIYATIGIPLTLVLLSAVVDRLLIPANWMLGSLNSRLGHLYQPFNIRLLHLAILIFIIGTLFFAIPTFIFAYLEPTWGILDAFYYCFISMTTIGLGDYIPGDTLEQPNRALYKILTTCYLFLGLIGMMLTLTVFYDIPQLNLGQLFSETNAEETEKLRLSGGRCYSGPSGIYIPQRDEEVRRAVVRIRPRDSPSPEDTTPMHARDLRVP